MGFDYGKVVLYRWTTLSEMVATGGHIDGMIGKGGKATDG